MGDAEMEPKRIQSGVEFARAKESVLDAAGSVFEDPRVRSLGVGRYGTGFGFRVVRNSAQIVPLAARPTLSKINGIPLSYVDTPHEVEAHVKVPHTGPGSPGSSSLIQEQNDQRPLCAGLQIQNFDDDTRSGVIPKGYIIVGTLGCFVKRTSGSTAILSNNHVVAGENRGVAGDRILQSGNSTFDNKQLVAKLTDFVKLQISPNGATIIAGNVSFNDVDAGIAELETGLKFSKYYLPSRSLTSPTGAATPSVGDKVFKVGRTTGLTYGEIVDTATVVGPIGYTPGPCWFRNSMTIEGDNGTMFSDHGDSGSAIVRADGKVLGILYAGNGVQTYACPIDTVLSELKCTLY